MKATKTQANLDRRYEAARDAIDALEETYGLGTDGLMQKIDGLPKTAQRVAQVETAAAQLEHAVTPMLMAFTLLDEAVKIASPADEESWESHKRENGIEDPEE